MTRKDYIKLAEIIKDSSYLLKVDSRHVVLDRGDFMQAFVKCLRMITLTLTSESSEKPPARYSANEGGKMKKKLL